MLAVASDELKNQAMKVKEIDLTLWTDYIAKISNEEFVPQDKVVTQKYQTMRLQLSTGVVEIPLNFKSKAHLLYNYPYHLKLLIFLQELDELVSRSTSLSKRAIKRMKKVPLQRSFNS